MTLKLFLNKFLAIVSFLVIMATAIVGGSSLLASLLSFLQDPIKLWVSLISVSIYSGCMVPLSIYAATKVSYTNCLLFELFGRTFYIRPWNFFMPNARSNYPRKVYGVGEIPDNVIEDIKNSKMDPKHDHLNKYYDDTH
jgi:hypothetical protein